MRSRRAFPGSQFHKSMKKPRCGIGLKELLKGEGAPGKGKQQQGQGWEVTGIWEEMLSGACGRRGRERVMQQNGRSAGQEEAVPSLSQMALGF